MDAKPDPAFQSPFLRGLHARLLASCQRGGELAGELTVQQLNWKPAAGEWSVAQCLDHLSRGAELYAEQLQPAVERARAAGRTGTPGERPRHTLMGRLILMAVEPTAKRKASAPGVFKPAESDIDAGVVGRFVSSHKVIAKLMLHSDGLDLARVKLGSPVTRLIRLNAADAFQILVDHAERHLNQAQRVLETGFSESGGG